MKGIEVSNKICKRMWLLITSFADIIAREMQDRRKLKWEESCGEEIKLGMSEDTVGFEQQIKVKIFIFPFAKSGFSVVKTK